MMKKILSFQMVVIAFITMSFGQNLTLSIGSTPLANNESIELWGDSGLWTLITSHVSVNNISLNPIDVLVRKTEINILPGSRNTFCWTTCYDTNTYVSPASISISGNSSNTVFSGEYWPKGHIGATTIRYTFYNKLNANDSVSFIAVYNSGVTFIADKPATVEFSNAFPNPANSFVNFIYNLQGTRFAEFVISDLLGSEIYKTNLQNESNNLSVNITDLNPGVYFYSLRVDGTLQFTRKLIVRH